MQDPTIVDSKVDSKKKKSAFRITSIIDPVKNDDEDDDKASIVDGSEESYSASRFRVIKSQTPNPRTFYSGRWKVKETYMVELSNHKEESKTSGTSVTSMESTGDNARCVTPHSAHSQNSSSNDDRGDSLVAPKLDTSFLDAQETQFLEYLKLCRDTLSAQHTYTTAISRKYENLKRDYEKLKEQNAALLDEMNRLKSK